MRTAHLITAAMMLASAAHATATPLPTKPEPRTPAAVLAADEAWSKAERDGDAAYVGWLLDPEYQSVGRDGRATGKAAIVANAASHAGSSGYAARVDEWKAQHPLRADVRIAGDTAVLTWLSLKPSAGEPVSSSDVFVRRDGHWHAVYSQHSDASA